MTKTTTSLIGKRIRLVRTNDPYTKLVAGDLGVITNVRDDLWGNSIVSVAWDSGSSLSLIEGEDSFTIISEREQFATALENFVQSTLELSLAWERLDEQFAEYLNTLDWGVCPRTLASSPQGVGRYSSVCQRELDKSAEQ